MKATQVQISNSNKSSFTVAKKLLLAAGLAAGFSVNAFAWVHADNQAVVCNKTVNQTFKFVLTGKYQANTNDDASAEFMLYPGSCHEINYWLQYQMNPWDNDDTLEFTDQYGAGSFHIQGTTHTSALGSYLYAFDMPEFNYLQHSMGEWSTFKGGSYGKLTFDIIDAFSDATASAKNQ